MTQDSENEPTEKAKDDTERKKKVRDIIHFIESEARMVDLEAILETLEMEAQMMAVNPEDLESEHYGIRHRAEFQMRSIRRAILTITQALRQGRY